MDDSDSDDGHDGDEPANKKEWVRKVSTHLNFLSGFNAFPGKRPGRLNPTIIFDAVQRCNIDRARELLMVERNVNAVNTSGSSLTHVAVRSGDWRVLDLVLGFHPKVNVKDGKSVDAGFSKSVGGGTPLHDAVSIGNHRMVNMLLQSHADPSIVDAHGSTPLHICAKKGYAEIAKDLIQHCYKHKILGPNLEPLAEIMDRGGKVASYWAREFAHDSMLELVVQGILPVRMYDPLEHFETSIKNAENRVWKKEGKKKKGKKGGKGKKDEKGGKKKKK